MNRGLSFSKKGGCEDGQSSDDAMTEATMLNSSFSHDSDGSLSCLLPAVSASVMRNRACPRPSNALPVFEEEWADGEKGKVHSRAGGPSKRKHHILLIGTLAVLLLLYRVWRPTNRKNPPKFDRLEMLRSTKEEEDMIQRIRRARPKRFYTIRLVGQRIDLLHRAVDRYGHCDSVNAIFVEWIGHETLPSSLLGHWTGRVTTTLPTSAAIFNVDESVQLLACADLERGFIEWRRDPTRVVGLAPMSRDFNKTSLVSDRAAFLHPGFAPYLTTAKPRIASNPACEQFFLSAKVAILTNQPATRIVTSTISSVEEEQTHNQCSTILMEAAEVESLPQPKAEYMGLPSQ